MFARLIKRLSPARIIACGFLFVILLGSLLLMLPCSVREGVELHYIDALYTATSAVCVTGLIAIDVGTAFTPLGQFFVAALIQIGGLGVTSVGAGIIIAMRKKIDLKSRVLIREGANLDPSREAGRFVKSVFLTTLAFELVGAALSFITFSQHYDPLPAIGYSLFHAVAAFNNSGFDNLGHSGALYSNQNLFAFEQDILLNVVTAALIFFGGIGFLVIRELKEKRFRLRKLSLHAKVVLSVSLSLIPIGALLLLLTERGELSLLSAFFHSVSARTAGFSTHDMGLLSDAGLLVLTMLMFIGASPGSTGGGIKTTTFFVLLQGVKSAATNKSEKAFHYSLPKDAFRRAAVITLLSVFAVLVSTFLLLAFEMSAGNPQVELSDALFEMTSAFGTVGLSTGITSGLSVPSKLLSILMMYVGRLGPLTVASLWYFTKGERVRYPDGDIAIG